MERARGPSRVGWETGFFPLVCFRGHARLGGSPAHFAPAASTPGGPELDALYVIPGSNALFCSKCGRLAALED